MQAQEVNLRQLLENSRKQLTQPFGQTQRTLLVLLNVSYLIMAALFLTSEKVATGSFVPHPALAWVYSSVGFFNLISAVYNFALLKGRTSLNLLVLRLPLNKSGRLDKATRWSSVASIMVMSFCNMTGLGNPSSDAILTDFALAHSLIVLSAMLLGRPASFVWFLVVITVLFYVTFVQRGYTYQYNYLTPNESARYERALEQKKPWALARQVELEANSLNPPRVSRYFDIWLVFILVAYATSYFCMGITLDVFKIIPQVTEDIKEAIDATSRQELDRERERSQAEEQRLLLRQETLSAELKTLKAQINPHFLFNTLHSFFIKSSEISQDLAEAIMKLSEIMRYSMQEDVDWVPLNEEINYMQQFIDLYQLRYSNQLVINFEVVGDTRTKQIPPFLLIGLLENAFKHGKLNDKTHPLSIRVEATPTLISFYSRNLKNKKAKVASSYIGLTNLQKRLALTYHDHYNFSVEQDENFYSCYLTINTELL